LDLDFYHSAFFKTQGLILWKALRYENSNNSILAKKNSKVWLLVRWKLKLIQQQRIENKAVSISISAGPHSILIQRFPIFAILKSVTTGGLGANAKA